MNYPKTALVLLVTLVACADSPNASTDLAVESWMSRTAAYPYYCDQRALMELDQCGQDWWVGYNSCLTYAGSSPNACRFDLEWWNRCVVDVAWDVPPGWRVRAGGLWSPLASCTGPTYRVDIEADCHYSWRYFTDCLRRYGNEPQ